MCQSKFSRFHLFRWNISNRNPSLWLLCFLHVETIVLNYLMLNYNLYSQRSWHLSRDIFVVHVLLSRWLIIIALIFIKFDYCLLFPFNLLLKINLNGMSEVGKITVKKFWQNCRFCFGETLNCQKQYNFKLFN